MRNIKSLIKLTVVLLLVLVLVYGIRTLLSEKGVLTKEDIINDITSEISIDIETMQNFEEEHHHNEETEIYTTEAQSDVLEKNQNPEYVAKFVFGAASLQDKDLFASSFDFETLNQDLFTVETVDKDVVLDEMMNRLTRNQSITSINIVTATQRDIDTTVDVKALLKYQDGLEKNVEFSLIPTFTEHFDDDGIFSISTSVWMIIQQIEGL